METIIEDRAMWLLFTSALFPAGILQFFYNQNSIYVNHKLVLLSSLISVAFSLVVFLVVTFLFRNAFVASIFTSLFWISVFLESMSHKIMLALFNRVIFYYLFWIILCGLLVFVLRKIMVKSKISLLYCTFVSVFITLSFFNSARIILFSLNVSKPEYKTDFFIQQSVDRPNIYWIHCDGMLSFDAVEEYFGESQIEFKQSLVDRGFTINESAKFQACNKTSVAVPALMCPFFYDTYLGDILSNQKSCEKAKSQSVQAILKEARLYNETFGAFTAAGYNTHSVALLDQYFFPTTDTFYYPYEDKGIGDFVVGLQYQYPFLLGKMDKLSTEEAMNCIQISETQNFMYTFFRPSIYLFSLQRSSSVTGYTGFNLFNSQSSESDIVAPLISQEETDAFFLGADASITHRYFANALEDILINTDESEPRFTLLLNVMFHGPYIYDEFGNLLNHIDYNDPLNYLSQHKYATKVLVNCIDRILINDPNAIVILQSDHGMNMVSDQDIIDAFGDDPHVISDLRSSTMSAIFIPQQYVNGEEVYAAENPLNISRYLVNRFVGQNYEYISNT